MCCPIEHTDRSSLNTTMTIGDEICRTTLVVTPSPAPLTPPAAEPDCRKRVRFLDHLDFSPTPSPLNLFDSDDEWYAAWYRSEDLEVFRNEARDLCRQMRLIDDSTHCSVCPKAPRLPSLARDSLTRGLEQRSCPERQRRKYVTTRFILKVASKLRDDPHKLAAVAHKCSAWATVLAIEEGARDLYRVAVEVSAAGRNPLRSKRSPDWEAANGRRVRPRPALIQA